MPSRFPSYPPLPAQQPASVPALILAVDPSTSRRFAPIPQGPLSPSFVKPSYVGKSRPPPFRSGALLPTTTDAKESYWRRTSPPGSPVPAGRSARTRAAAAAATTAILLVGAFVLLGSSSSPTTATTASALTALDLDLAASQSTLLGPLAALVHKLRPYLLSSAPSLQSAGDRSEAGRWAAPVKVPHTLGVAALAETDVLLHAPG